MNKIIEIPITESTDFCKPSIERKHPICNEGGEGIQKIWRFKNGFGASVVRFRTMFCFGGSYGYENGLYELGVIKFNEDGDFRLTYKTKITNDVIGHLTIKEVEIFLKKIKRLHK